MNDSLIIDKLIDLLQQLKKESSNKSFALSNTIRYMTFIKCQNSREVQLVNEVFQKLFGYTFKEIEIQITKEQNAIRKEFEELDEFVEELKNKRIFYNPVFPEDAFEIDKKSIDSDNSLKNKVVMIGTSGDIYKTDFFKILWEKHIEKDVNEKKPLIIDTSRIYSVNHIDLSEKIKETIPKINDNYLLTERLKKLKIIEQRLKKLPKSERGELKEIQLKINTIKSWM